MAYADPTIFNRLISGRKTVSSAGTAEALSSVSIGIKGCVVCAEDSNTGTISVGGQNGTVAVEPTRTGIYLLTADCAMIPVNDLSNIYVNSTINGDGVTFGYYQ